MGCKTNSYELAIRNLQVTKDFCMVLYMYDVIILHGQDVTQGQFLSEI